MIQNIVGHEEKINSVVVTPDGNFFLSASDDRTIRLWQAQNGICRHIFKGHTNTVNAIAVTSDGQFAISGSDDCTLKLWSLGEGICLRTFEGHIDSVNTVAISPDCSYFVSGSSDGNLRQWDLQTGECLQTFKRHPAFEDRDGLNSLIRSSNAEFCYHDYIGHLGIARTYNEDDDTFFGHADPVTAVAISPNGRFLASGSKDTTLRLWQVKTGECIWIFGGLNRGANFGIHDIIITPNGKYLLSASETLQAWRLIPIKFRRWFWTISRERPYRKFKKANRISGDITISPSGSHIAAIENSGERIGIYQFRTGRLLRAHEILSDLATAIAFTPDGGSILVGNISGGLQHLEVFKRDYR